EPAATVVVPERVAPLVPVQAVIVSVTSPAKLVAVCPEASRTVTWTAGLMVTPAVVLPGWAVNTSAEASAAVMSNGALVAAVRPGAVAVAANTLIAALVDVRPVALAVTVYQESPLSIVRFENVATPFRAPTVVVPESVAPLIPVPAAIATVTLPVKLVTGLPDASS